MSYRIAISFAAAAIGISCIASDASAGGRGGSAPGGRPPPPSANKAIPSIGPSGGGAGGPTGGGAASTTGSGAAVGSRYYAPASYSSTTACGRYPYPPCKKVPTR
jgi:hypothetical protein